MSKNMPCEGSKGMHGSHCDTEIERTLTIEAGRGLEGEMGMGTGGSGTRRMEGKGTRRDN